MQSQLALIRQMAYIGVRGLHAVGFDGNPRVWVGIDHVHEPLKLRPYGAIEILLFF